MVRFTRGTIMSETGALAEQLSPVRTMSGRLLVPLTIFLGAFLLFGVEPLIAKMILPWFGGSAEVWIVSLLFFQTALLAGYLYAHLLTTRLGAAWQWRVHFALLAVSLLFLPIIPSEGWKPEGGEEPLPFILGTLTSTIGLPFLLLASTGPLIQAWLSRSRAQTNIGTHSIYRLYALSNFGSLLALLLYPVLVEPSLPTRMQAWSWSISYAVFVLLSAGAAWSYRNAVIQTDLSTANDQMRPSLGARVLWFLFAMAPSALLLAMTNHILRNIAAIPLLWVVPLGLYLLSFIIAFDHPRWYYRPFWYTLFIAAAGAMIFVVGIFFGGGYVAQLAFFTGGLFVCCMVCHGELAALKPAPSYLTSFYLIIASGGAAGGLFVAAIAPTVLNQDFDLAIVLPSLALLVLLVAWRRVPPDMPVWLRWNILIAVIYAFTFVTGYMAIRVYRDSTGHLFTARNFYGPLRVTIRPANAITEEIVQLRNGNIVHGREFTAPEKRCEPISYYGRQSGIGATLQEMGKDGPLKVGVIGLGAGMLGGYGRQGDIFRFYEINPLVRTVATRFFHYLECPAESDVVIGDARLSLEAEAPQQFDVLAVDAFTSDAIPIHLLTTEAFQLYWRHLKPDGILAVHVSNRFVDLAPIVALAAEQSGKTARLFSSLDDPYNAIDGSSWVLVASGEEVFERALLKWAQPIGGTRGLRPWTDDYSNLWQSLK